MDPEGEHVRALYPGHIPDAVLECLSCDEVDILELIESVARGEEDRVPVSYDPSSLEGYRFLSQITSRGKVGCYLGK